jgi:toxin-antitoxin system PIN domain toxin
LLRPTRYLLDVNVLVALLNEDHLHHRSASQWFNVPGIQWALCPFTEAGLLRTLARPMVGNVSVSEATFMLEGLTQKVGYHYQAISVAWQELCRPFLDRLFGHKQITDAYLLGLAIREGLVLVTFDRAILHMARNYSGHVLLLTE